MDEISTNAPTQVAELKDGEVRTLVLEPAVFGIEPRDPQEITVSSPAESLELIRAVFAGEDSPATDIVVLNSGAAIYVAGLTPQSGRGNRSCPRGHCIRQGYWIVSSRLSKSPIVSRMSQPPDVLRAIIQDKLDEVASAKQSVPISELKSRLADTELPRGFEAKIHARLHDGHSAVIAECKKASPSKGVIRADYDVRTIAASYEKGGAACLSVLTDRKYFQGSLQDLTAARKACALPALRKDFIIDPYQLYESRAAGADCILLIVAALEPNQIRELGGIADRARDGCTDRGALIPGARNRFGISTRHDRNQQP